MSQPQAPARDLRLAFFALLGVWISIELLHSSRWLEEGSWRSRPQAEAKAQDRLANLLAPSAGQPPERVWFAPYTTFPETGMVESQLRGGVYDTFLAFPRAGLTSNYGAYKLTVADSLFAQASSQGLRQEALLAQRLGYRQFAIDLGAITTPQPLQALCERSPGCRLSSDGYALFPLGQTADQWIPDLERFHRRQPDLPQITAAPRWGGLVFHRDQWWPPEIRTGSGSSDFLIWARPRWEVQLYRHDASSLPREAKKALHLPDDRIWLRLAPGLDGVTLCLKRERPWWHGGDTPCRVISLQDSAPRIEISSLLAAGQITTLKLEWIYGPEGLPYPLRMLPTVNGYPSKQAAFAIEIKHTQGTLEKGGHQD